MIFDYCVRYLNCTCSCLLRLILEKKLSNHILQSVAYHRDFRVYMFFENILYAQFTKQLRFGQQHTMQRKSSFCNYGIFLHLQNCE